MIDKSPVVSVVSTHAVTIGGRGGCGMTEVAALTG